MALSVGSSKGREVEERAEQSAENLLNGFLN